MKECLHCKKEFDAKRPHAKFCSAKCRVAYNRAHPQQSVSKLQMQTLYNEIKAYFDNQPPLQIIPPITPETAAALRNTENKDQLTTVTTYDYDGLKRLLRASTSSEELRTNWDIVIAGKLAGWQMRELTRIKEDQQTKLDF